MTQAKEVKVFVLTNGGKLVEALETITLGRNFRAVYLDLTKAYLDLIRGGKKEPEKVGVYAGGDLKAVFNIRYSSKRQIHYSFVKFDLI